MAVLFYAVNREDLRAVEGQLRCRGEAALRRGEHFMRGGYFQRGKPRSDE
jgi:hypothetical protein